MVRVRPPRKRSAGKEREKKTTDEEEKREIIISKEGERTGRNELRKGVSPSLQEKKEGKKKEGRRTSVASREGCAAERRGAGALLAVEPTRGCLDMCAQRGGEKRKKMADTIV